MKMKAHARAGFKVCHMNAELTREHVKSLGMHALRRRHHATQHGVHAISEQIVEEESRIPESHQE